MFKQYLLNAARIAALFLFVFAMGALPIGCAEEAPPEEEEKPAAPPPPSVDQLRNELTTAFKPILDLTIPGGPLETVQQTVQNFKQVHSKVNGQRASNPNVEPAVAQVKNLIEDNIKLASERDRWRFIWGSIECYETLDPASTKYKQKKEQAMIMMKMPGVKLKGFVQVEGDDQPYAMFDVFDTEVRKLFNYRVREGEEFHNGRFVFIAIRGNQMGADVLYKDADYEFKVGGPRDRVTTIGDDENTE